VRDLRLDGFQAPRSGTVGGYLNEEDVFLTRKEAAEYLRRSIPTLERWASEGTGPPIRKLSPRGAVLYPLSGLRAFVAGKAA
jgi:hypothetical protein